MAVHDALRVDGRHRREEHRRDVVGAAGLDLGLVEARDALHRHVAQRPASSSASSGASPAPHVVVAQPTGLVVPDRAAGSGSARAPRSACRPAPGPRRSHGARRRSRPGRRTRRRPRPGTAAPAPRRATGRRGARRTAAAGSRRRRRDGLRVAGRRRRARTPWSAPGRRARPSRASARCRRPSRAAPARADALVRARAAGGERSSGVIAWVGSIAPILGTSLTPRCRSADNPRVDTNGSLPATHGDAATASPPAGRALSPTCRGTGRAARQRARAELLEDLRHIPWLVRPRRRRARARRLPTCASSTSRRASSSAVHRPAG